MRDLSRRTAAAWGHYRGCIQMNLITPFLPPLSPHPYLTSCLLKSVITLSSFIVVFSVIREQMEIDCLGTLRTKDNRQPHLMPCVLTWTIARVCHETKKQDNREYSMRTWIDNFILVKGYDCF